MTDRHDDVLRFVSATFPSVWALEILLLLRREPRSWSHTELVSALRASDLIVNIALDRMTAAGLVTTDEDGARYSPVDVRSEQAVEATEKLYSARPNTIRRAIVSGAAGPASAFADAFRLRRTDND